MKRSSSGWETAIGPLFTFLLVLGLHVFPAQAQPAAVETPLTSTATQAYDLFGQTVALSGEYALVGAHLHDVTDQDEGAAYVFVRSGTTWAQQARLTASDGTTSDFFGQAVALSGDYALVGADRADTQGMDAGAAYVFVRNGTAWTQQAKLTADDGDVGDFFGQAVALSGDYALVGAEGADPLGDLSGAAYVFVRNGTAWTQQAKLTPLDGQAGDGFGHTVSISGDYALVGARFADERGHQAGAAYIFVRSGTSWTQQAKLTADDAQENDQFGQAVALSGDDALIGAFSEDSKGDAAGAAYVFVRSGTTWTQQAKITAPDAQGGDVFGLSVALSGDNALLGAPLEDSKGLQIGAAYVYTRSGTVWNPQGKLLATDGAVNDFFGVSVALSGEDAFIGAYGSDTEATEAGAAYVFVRSGTAWTQQAKITAAEPLSPSALKQAVEGSSPFDNQ
jgi:hypothetical protein